MRTLQRDKSHRLLLLCCSIGYFSSTWHVDVRGWITTATRQIQLAAALTLPLCSAIALSMPYIAVREVQLQLLHRRDTWVLML